MKKAPKKLRSLDVPCLVRFLDTSGIVRDHPHLNINTDTMYVVTQVDRWNENYGMVRLQDMAELIMVTAETVTFIPFSAN